MNVRIHHWRVHVHHSYFSPQWDCACRKHSSGLCLALLSLLQPACTITLAAVIWWESLNSNSSHAASYNWGHGDQLVPSGILYDYTLIIILSWCCVEFLGLNINWTPNAAGYLWFKCMKLLTSNSNRSTTHKTRSLFIIMLTLDYDHRTFSFVVNSKIIQSFSLKAIDTFFACRSQNVTDYFFPVTHSVIFMIPPPEAWWRGYQLWFCSKFLLIWKWIQVRSSWWHIPFLIDITFILEPPATLHATKLHCAGMLCTPDAHT